MPKQVNISSKGSIGFFDGASQNGFRGGGGLLLSIHNQNKNFGFWIGLGRGTNNRAELLALWALLKLARLLFCPNLKVYGDSKIIVDWASRINQLQHIIYRDWC